MFKEIKSMFDLYNCDKAEKHHYHKIYGPEFESRRNQNLNILEVGIFKGSSTRALMDYFPNANFYGIDIFERVAIEAIDISAS